MLSKNDITNKISQLLALDALITTSGLSVGDNINIPGEKIS